MAIIHLSLYLDKTILCGNGQVTASRNGSEIRILNEPINGSSVFLVETGEGWTPPNPPFLELVREHRALMVKFQIDRKYFKQ
jgi:hypothetical protein